MNRAWCLLSIAAALAASSCHQVAASPDVQAAAPKEDPFEVSVTPELLKNLRIGKVTSQSVSNSFTVSGRVEADETRQARVGTPITGRVVDLLVREGDHVRKGQVLALLNSTELTMLQSSFLKAHSQAMLAERAVNRAQQLLDAGVIGSAELQRRQAELSQATAEVASLRGQLKVLGMPEEAAEKLEGTRAVNATSQVIASIDGIVLERKATVGQVVQPADMIFLLADLSRVWIVADVPEQTAGNLAEGQFAQAEVSSLKGLVVRGQLTHVHSILNPETRTLTVHMDVDNPRGRLKPAMLATMTLKEPAVSRRTIPITAVIRENNREYVFTQTTPSTFRMREVTLGPEFDGMRVVEGGMQSEETLVLDGAFHLNNERKRLALARGAR